MSRAGDPCEERAPAPDGRVGHRGLDRLLVDRSGIPSSSTAAACVRSDAEPA
ncbi:MAG: hypothetical protein AVDCRST_MAG66-3470 [uncultured Pseudonocardia sp.]|uniref:Uncharacterized protein n=1 Tax=uncultured Pseudonocardia sp. TaxID=211455 RepID=A0A6J4Q8W5_9PSEU|nr:MAG: hypothetical protein AVDCRST_MAG66-3470 [uncultured Pseudonocardia sp.]